MTSATNSGQALIVMLRSHALQFHSEIVWNHRGCQNFKEKVNLSSFARDFLDWIGQLLSHWAVGL